MNLNHFRTGSFFGLIVAIWLSSAEAGQVRSLLTNDRTMQTIYLTMGRSTVLRFDEKPKSAVIGNQNYFALEYIGNDITIQPQGHTTTNLFVYTEYQTYGLILQVGTGGQYDDLVNIRFSPGYVTSKSERKPKRLVNEVALAQKIEIKGTLKLKIDRAIQSVTQGTWILEFSLENLSADKINLEEVRVNAFNSETELPGQRTVFEKESLASKERTRGRLLVRTARILGSDIEVAFHGNKKKLNLREGLSR